MLREVFARRGKLYFSISATTRPPRPGERDGVDYLFLTREKFLELLAAGELLEHAEYVGNFYGTPARPIAEHTQAGDDAVLDIEIQGARQVKKRLPDAVSVFIAPPSLEELERRLRGRSTESEEKILGRLETARRELGHTDEYDYVVVNDDVGRAAGELLGIMEKEKMRRAARCSGEPEPC